MYPNRQDVLPLPPRPSLEHYEMRVQELACACRDGAIDTWAEQWVRALLDANPDLSIHARRDAARHLRQVAAFGRERHGPTTCSRAEAQFVIARAHGFASWSRFAAHLEALSAHASVGATLG